MKKTLILSMLIFSAIGILQAQKLTLLTPNGGDTLVSGMLIKITWSYAHMTGKETVLIALEGAVDYGPIAYKKVSDRSMEWLVGQKMDGTFAKPAKDYKIIIEAVDEMAYDLSDKDFTIVPAAAKVVMMAPNGGETLEKGSLFDINWSFAGKGGYVSLALIQKDQPLGLIVKNLAASALHYQWKVGNPLLSGSSYPPGSDYRIQIHWHQKPSEMSSKPVVAGKMSSAAGPQAQDADNSDGAFSIIARKDKVPPKPDEKQR